jgi:activator of HSP90 ATPase
MAWSMGGMALARRQFLMGAITGVITGAALGVAKAVAAPVKSTPSLHQEVDFPVSPHRVYAALLDEKEFAAITGAPAKLGGREGDAFSLFGGAIVGRNLELVPDRRIVQAWRSADWGPGLYSVARFELSAVGQGTHLAFDQVGYPLSDYASLVPGWHSHYWEPMKKYFASK